jgi:hypothetical protein
LRLISGLGIRGNDLKKTLDECIIFTQTTINYLIFNTGWENFQQQLLFS